MRSYGTKTPCSTLKEAGLSHQHYVVCFAIIQFGWVIEQLEPDRNPGTDWLERVNAAPFTTVADPQSSPGIRTAR